MVVDTHKESAQKQSVKSVCLLLQNQKVAKMPLLLQCVKDMVQETISVEMMHQHQKQLKML